MINSSLVRVVKILSDKMFSFELSCVLRNKLIPKNIEKNIVNISKSFFFTTKYNIIIRDGLGQPLIN